MVKPKRGDVYLVRLDPTEGSEIKKTRPAMVVSPDELNDHLQTVIIAPLTSNLKTNPFKVSASFAGKQGTILLHQLRTVDKSRLVKKLGALDPTESLGILVRMFTP